jgi:hypothetical protein
MRGDQVLILPLDSQLVRRTRAFVASTDSYRDLPEFVAVAVENQLALEEEGANGHALERVENGTPPPVERPSEEESDAFLDFLTLPSGAPAALALPPETGSPLLPLTNRLFPIKVAARVLANTTGDHLPLARFHQIASEAARALGARLRQEDATAQRRGSERRWIALPVGADRTAALDRYVHHFTLTTTPSDRLQGPLAQLGLAALTEQGEPQLTAEGARLALANNPVLDSSDGGDRLLSDEEQAIFAPLIRANTDEWDAVREFLDLIDRHQGHQNDIDASLGLNHPKWSRAQRVAHRAAMAGRLRDLGITKTKGRGATARIIVTPQAQATLRGE